MALFIYIIYIKKNRKTIINKQLDFKGGHSMRNQVNHLFLDGRKINKYENDRTDLYLKSGGYCLAPH